MAANQPSHTPKPERNAPFCGKFGHLSHDGLQHVGELANSQRHDLKTCFNSRHECEGLEHFGERLESRRDVTSRAFLLGPR